MNNTVILNGLVWDTENLVIEGRTHFNYDEAVEIAENYGKRLPTKREFEVLSQLPHCWDVNNHGMWFAERVEDLKTNKSLFLPAAGYRNYNSNLINCVGELGYYWSISTNGNFLAYNLYLENNFINTAYYPQRLNCTVRCVSKL